MSNNPFSALDSVKMTCQTHMYKRFLQNYSKEKTCLHFHWLTLNMKTVILLRIRNDDHTKMINILHFSSLQDEIQRTQMKMFLLMNSNTLISLWILVCPIGIIEISTSRKCSFWLYFISLYDYWPPSTWNSLVHTSWCEMEPCEKRVFQILKMRKNISWNIKRSAKQTFYLLLCLRVWRIILVIRWWAHKRLKFTLISIKIMRI